MGKFLGTSEAQRNGVTFFHIYGRSHHKFNERISSWMWEKGVSFSILREYLRIIHKMWTWEKKKVKNFQAWMWTWECCLGVFDIHVSENMCENVCKYVSNVKKVDRKSVV